MKLNIGCGNVRIPGYTNVDIRYCPNVDIIDNVRYLRKFKNECVEEIYASHVLEHFCRWDADAILSMWNSVLCENGRLVIAVPDFEAIAEYYLKTKDINALKGLLYGGQDYPENNHHNCWDFESLKACLIRSGFQDVCRYDWKSDPIFSSFDDYSKCYLPHMDFDSGKLMSLNVTAVKKQKD